MGEFNFPLNLKEYFFYSGGSYSKSLGSSPRILNIIFFSSSNPLPSFLSAPIYPKTFKSSTANLLSPYDLLIARHQHRSHGKKLGQAHRYHRCYLKYCFSNGIVKTNLITSFVAFAFPNFSLFYF